MFYRKLKWPFHGIFSKDWRYDKSTKNEVFHVYKLCW